MTLLRLKNIVLLAIAVALSAAGRASAQSASDYFEPLVSHHQFAMLVRDLELSREQRMIVELVFSDYLDEIARLSATADAEADQVGRKRVMDALSGRTVIDPAELRRLRLAVLDVYESHLAQVDASFEQLTLGIESVLVDEQQSKIKAELRNLRRAVVLHPRHSERTFHEYAGEGVDVLRLYERATAGGGELEGLDAAAVAQIQEQYEHDLDQLLIESSLGYRLSRMKLRKARISRDAQDLAEAEEQVIAQWHRLYTLNEQTVRRIGDVAAAELGQPASDRWMQRFHRECFEWMFSQHGPDRQYEWLLGQRLGEEQRELAEAIYEEYLEQRFVLASRAISLMIQARSEIGSIIYSMMDPTNLQGRERNMYDQLLRNSGEMATLDASTTDAFENILDRDQRRSFRNAFRRR